MLWRMIVSYVQMQVMKSDLVWTEYLSRTSFFFCADSFFILIVSVFEKDDFVVVVCCVDVYYGFDNCVCGYFEMDCFFV